MAANEKTSKKVASIAGKALRNPSAVTKPQIKKLAATALTQTQNKKPAKKKLAKKKK